MLRLTKRRAACAVLSLALVASGTILGLSTLSASGAVAMNRFSITCAKGNNGVGGYDTSLFRKQVDPIVSFGIAQSAHVHDFYCMRAISQNMSAAAVQAVSRQVPGGQADPGWGPFPSNASMYGYWPGVWFPTPKFNGTLIPTGGMLTDTWQAPAGVAVKAPPFGELAIVGSASATTPSDHVRFTCGDANAGQFSGIDGPGSPVPQDCSSIPGGRVTLELTFPNCWDGLGVTTAANGVFTFDHPAGISPSHFTYAVDGKCPVGSIPCVPGTLMAQLITQLQFIDPRTNLPMTNPYNADGTLGLSFSSGDYNTAHGDYMQTSNHNFGHVIDKCLTHGTPGSCPPGTIVDGQPIA